MREAKNPPCPGSAAGHEQSVDMQQRRLEEMIYEKMRCSEKPNLEMWRNAQALLAVAPSVETSS